MAAVIAHDTRMCMPLRTPPENDYGIMQEDDDNHQNDQERQEGNSSQQPKDWRCESGSDWTIKVGCMHSLEYHSYQVHESVIANGPVHCGYFSRLFQNKDMIKASGTSVIPIQLDRRDAELFPTFLDFLYCSSRFRITSETAVGLRHLAEFFKVPRMLDATWNFIKEDMVLHRLEQYLRDANEFGDTQTANWVAFECAKNIMDLDPFAPVLRILTPENFKQVIYLARLSHRGNSSHWSELVAVYCMDRAKELDAMWFKELTSSGTLPVISPRAALKLMETEFIVRSLSTVVESPTSARLSSLQRRCVKALAEESGMKNPEAILRKY